MVLKIVVGLLICSSFAFGVEIDTILEKIIGWSSSNTVKLILTIVLMGLCVWMYKNIERINEWGFKVFSLIIIILTFLNARTIAGWFF